MKIDALYAKYGDVLVTMNVNPIKHSVFDLSDENSLNSVKKSIPGIESQLMPENGKYLVLTTIVEDPNVLLMLFPETIDGNVGIKAFNMSSKHSKDLTENIEFNVDNFNQDFANMEEVAKRFNEFVFNTEGEDSTNEVKDIGSFDVSNDEPVKINNTNTDNEETEMKFHKINEEITDTNEPKWVEIPDSNAHKVTVEDGEQEDPFAGDMPADGGDAPAPEGGDGLGAAPAQDAPAQDAPAQDAGETPDAASAKGDAPAEEPAQDAAPAENATIDDPKAKMRELLAYYTNYMNELVQDPNTSTDLISATQDMIDSLIKNMESADGIEEVKSDIEANNQENAEANVEEAPAEEAPAEGQDQPVTEGVDEEMKQDDVDAKIDADVDSIHADDADLNIVPITGDNILPPGDLSYSPVNDVDLSDVAPTSDEELAATTPDLNAPAPTSDVDVLTGTDDLTPGEEADLLDDGDDIAMVGADGLPIDTYAGNIEDDMSNVPCANKIAWSSDYALNGVATTDDNTNVVPAVLNELVGYYNKVADEVSKVPGKEDVAMKLQKIQILSQTIANEWNSVCASIGDTVANSYDRSNMGDLEKDELDSYDAMNQIGSSIMADQEKEEEDELAIDNQIDQFCEAFKHLI